jgi:hypothetical protein
MAGRGGANPWASEAALAALLRYQPQRSALGELQRAARERFHESVQAGQTQGVLQSQAVARALPETQAIFSNARKSGEAGRSLASPILAALSPDSPFRAAAANEQSAGAERLAQSESHALSDLRSQAVAASEAPAYARQAAAGLLLQELQKLDARGALLQGAEGADEAAELGRIRREASSLAGAERRSERSASTSRENNERSTSTSRENARETNQTRREAASGKASEPMSAKELAKAAAEVQTIRQYAGQSAGVSRAQRVAALVAGRPEQSVKNGQGRMVKVPARPAFKASVLMSAGLDYAEYGHLTRGTERRLEQAGYDPARLGVPRAPAPVRSPSDAGKRVARALAKVF